MPTVKEHELYANVEEIRVSLDKIAEQMVRANEIADRAQKVAEFTAIGGATGHQPDIKRRMALREELWPA